jgi:hypothetical protein
MSITVDELKINNLYLQSCNSACLKPADEEISQQSLKAYMVTQHILYFSYFLGGAPSLIKSNKYFVGGGIGLVSGAITGFVHKKCFGAPKFSKDWHDWAVSIAAQKTSITLLHGGLVASSVAANVAYTYIGEPEISAAVNGFLLGFTTGYNAGRYATEKTEEYLDSRRYVSLT